MSSNDPVNSKDRDERQQPAPSGALRKMLKLIVESDSRIASTRIGASLLLVGLIALFAVAGYAVPALYTRFF